jgi:pilus assembly protein FimV
MLDEQKNDSMSSAVQERLDDLFEETNTPKLIKEVEGNLRQNPLEKLKSLVLSIDWEITEEVLSDFLIQIDNLGILYKNDQIIRKFLKMLKVLGKYTRVHHSDAHPNAFKLLNSVFGGFEKIVTTQDMTDLDKQKLLNTELAKYKKLQRLISESREIKETEEQKEVSIIQNSKLLNDNWNINSAKNLEQKMILISGKKLNEAINEIKNYFHSEIKELKKMIILYHKK